MQHVSRKSYLFCHFQHLLDFQQFVFGISQLGLHGSCLSFTMSRCLQRDNNATIIKTLKETVHVVITVTFSYCLTSLHS